MAADLNRPKIVIPTGCPNGAVIIGTAGTVTAHTLVSGTAEVDVVTIYAHYGGGGSVQATVGWPATTGASRTMAVSITSVEPPLLILRHVGNGGGAVTVNGGTGVTFIVTVERYPAGDRPQE
jgi:hypothetical protein